MKGELVDGQKKTSRMVARAGGEIRSTLLACGSALALAILPSGANAELVAADAIYMVDGDTAKIGGKSYRLVGFDTPETYYAKCEYEKALGDMATERARSLIVNAGAVEFTVLPGQDKYNRGLARMSIQGKDLGAILITEGLARPYQGGKRLGWC